MDNIERHKPLGVASNEGDTSNALPMGLSFLITFILLMLITLFVTKFWLQQVTQTEIERLVRVAFVSFLYY